MTYQNITLHFCTKRSTICTFHRRGHRTIKNITVYQEDIRKMSGYFCAKLTEEEPFVPMQTENKIQNKTNK